MRICRAGFPLGLSLVVLAAGRSSGSSGSCQAAAQAQIRRAPDGKGMATTSSHIFKSQLAEHFCEHGAGMTVLELGTHHGHTTAVLAAIFRKVIAVDILKSSLDMAARHVGELANVFLLSLDLRAADWQAIASNDVSVVLVGANHDYQAVLSGVRNALSYFPSLRFLVFDDYFQDSVHRAVTELEEAGVLVNCEALGAGWDGRHWYVRSSRVNRSEGRICQAGHGNLGQLLKQSFLNRSFYVYRLPLNMHPSGYMRFLPDGSLQSSQWSDGAWRLPQDPGLLDDFLLLSIPGLSHEPLLLQFNQRRVAFLLCNFHTKEAEWFGLVADVLEQPFMLANQGFR
ncbi:unnamed protein product [Symbiodinium natans]|uniref:Methyltransferase domain-containing protein n=1 Tax=Symbiodinium natans TaxID=878477 RepID=A0A812N4M7_9DINO|nr:unnamed protein product [Symbiodinium natans]